jgi:hypothetical protein
MSIELLRQIAATPLPTSFANAKDVDAVRILRQAGLVIAVPEEPPEGGIKVVAITEKGNQELLHSHYPGHRQPDPSPVPPGSRWPRSGRDRPSERLAGPAGDGSDSIGWTGPSGCVAVGSSGPASGRLRGLT